MEGWRVASKGLGPLPRRRASALAHGCGRGGRVVLPLARAAAMSTGLRVPLLAGHPVVLQRRVLHLRLDGGGQGEAELSPPEESTWQGPNVRVASLAGAGYSGVCESHAWLGCGRLAWGSSARWHTTVLLEHRDGLDGSRPILARLDGRFPRVWCCRHAVEQVSVTPRGPRRQHGAYRKPTHPEPPWSTSWARS